MAEAFYCEPLAVAAIQREWAINLGRRDALERVAHLICELFVRLEMVGLVEGNSFALPVTQMDLADASGSVDGASQPYPAGIARRRA